MNNLEILLKYKVGNQVIADYERGTEKRSLALKIKCEHAIVNF